MTDKHSLMQQGLASLRQGDGEDASRQFQAIVDSGAEDSATWLAMAFARARLDQPDATLAAADRALELEPRNIRALLFKADHLDQHDRPRDALSFYQAALNLAYNMQDIPQDVRAALGRAERVTKGYTEEYEAYLRQSLSEQGYDGRSVERFAESLDIAVGKKQVHYQQPTRYYFPGLPQKTFYERKDFAWAESFESATAAIRGELLALMTNESLFSPYLEHDPDSPQINDTSNVGSRDWTALYLWRDGVLQDENAALCPKTVEALASVDAPMVPGQTPSALFSRLAPGATIAPHHGMLNTRLICHLPLIVPKHCGALRVGNRERAWSEGELLIFDDSMEHEAWNNSNRDRVVLLFDVWRPELSVEERQWVSAMLLAARAFGDG